ncbi:MAG: TetR/AcrR family transcriptional regulator [Ectothiorhodospiraceae bacterium]|nr:TetR/AcrR family transcriptional regulator [Ectothiorhodospiraceae bacterium]MCH8504669.1 TetR/AcrR family transcriptional regulator [Ectothiorhodospiraceae bacterium]
MTNATSTRRDQLLETATELFYRNGCHTTGIDRILAEAGVAKMTLYKHFKSKENLVLAAAERFNEKLREEFEEAVEAENLSPRARLLIMFDFMDKWVRRPDFCGCPSINLAVQYPDPEHAIHQATALHKQTRVEYVTELAEKAGARDPKALAQQLVLLIEGATVMIQITRDFSLAAQAKRAAETLIDAAIQA